MTAWGCLLCDEPVAALSYVPQGQLGSGMSGTRNGSRSPETPPRGARHTESAEYVMKENKIHGGIWERTKGEEKRRSHRSVEDYRITWEMKENEYQTETPWTPRVLGLSLRQLKTVLAVDGI